MYKYLVYILFFIIGIRASANDTISSVVPKKAIKYFEKAYQKYRIDSYKDSEKYAIKAINVEKSFIKPYLLLADIYRKQNNQHKLEQTYKAIMYFDKSNKYTIVYYRMGRIAFHSGEYETAKQYLLKYLEKREIQEKDRKLRLTKLMIESCKFAVKAMKTPVEFEPIRLSDSINTNNDEFLPVLTADEKTLILTVRVPVKNKSGEILTYQEDFYSSKKIKGIWQGIKPISRFINTHGNEGAQTISADGRTLYFTACNRNNGYGRCDIYRSGKLGNTWSSPVNLGPNVNTRDWESQPSISSDGLTIYFVSDRKGGMGKMDIWCSKYDGSQWAQPINMGKNINTPEDDLSPFIHPDNKTLYFASDGHIGMGGLDVYMTKKNDKGKWDKPKNLGYPINTSKDESGVIVNAKGNYALFATERERQFGMDIYKFTLEHRFRPNPVTYVKGVVYDKVTNKPIKAEISIYDIKTQKQVMYAKSDPVNGEFLVTLERNKNYALNISKDKYLFYSQNFNTIDKQKDQSIKVELPTIEVGSRTTLNNLFFEYNSYELKKESIIELKKVVRFLRKNPKVKLGIQGFTDNTGDKKYNLQLSTKRAKEVYSFLVYYSVPKDRLSYIGYGSRNPIASNKTKAGRQKNRRTEIVILEK